MWKCKNPINGLLYGYGGVKLFPRQMTIDQDVTSTDMTTSISPRFRSMPEVSNLTEFNTDPFNTWKSAFRECVKLSSKVIDRQKDTETEDRLDVWCTVDNGNFGNYCVAGAKQGREYGTANIGNTDALKKINDFNWLQERFNEQN